ncbi:WhiB family transcriptional regulator [Streptomyces phaeochromogenes]|uniref:WhiB family transcriptional regulator n=1 Tax=Streptomyces phaeochromogenes TaxID=1923 RepID=UPI0036A5F797
MEAEAPLPCRTDPDAYHAVTVRAAGARELCAGCPFAEACEAYAMARPALRGVWGGTTMRERQAARRQEAAEEETASRLLDGLLSR